MVILQIKILYLADCFHYLFVKMTKDLVLRILDLVVDIIQLQEVFYLKT